MEKTQKCVLDFMTTLGLQHNTSPSIEGLKDVNFDLQLELIQEEVLDELKPAIQNLKEALSADIIIEEEIIDIWTDVIDGLCDSIVVLHNLSNAMGIDLEPFFDEVHRTNMAKVGGPVRVDGKRLKPEGWEPPRIKAMLRRRVRLLKND